MFTKEIAIAVIVGIVITVLTGLLTTTPSGLVGASWHGWPMAWYTVPVVPNPIWNINYVNLLIDVVVWSVIVFVVWLAIVHFREGGTKPTAQPA